MPCRVVVQDYLSLWMLTIKGASLNLILNKRLYSVAVITPDSDCFRTFRQPRFDSGYDLFFLMFFFSCSDLSPDLFPLLFFLFVFFFFCHHEAGAPCYLSLVPFRSSINVSQPFEFAETCLEFNMITTAAQP